MPVEARYDVFISHNKADAAAARELTRRLLGAGLAVFLDERSLVPGQPWQDGLDAALESSTTCAVLLGPGGIGPWHGEEARIAMVRAVETRNEFRAIPVLLPGANPASMGSFLEQRLWVDFRSGLDDPMAIGRLIAGIKGTAVNDGGFELPNEPCPYRGLLFFDADHAQFFHGRDKERDELAAMVSQRSFVAVVGPSGVGKSSLVRAGLVPHLEQGQSKWRAFVASPGGSPFRSIAAQLAQVFPSTERIDAIEKMEVLLTKEPQGLSRALSLVFSTAKRPVLLFVDQLEDVFTHVPDGVVGTPSIAARFLDALRYAVDAKLPNVKIVVAMRSDFLDRALLIPGAKQLFQGADFMLGAMAQGELRRAIVMPAQQVGAMFEKGLVETILRDVEGLENSSLPLLGHALYELWLARGGPWLTIDAYNASEGVRGALNRRAQEMYNGLTDRQKKIARAILLRLTGGDEGTLDVRRRVARKELRLRIATTKQIRAVLLRLSGPNARLVVMDKEWVELAHDALIRHWDLFRDWLDSSRDARRIHRRLSMAAREWDEWRTKAKSNADENDYSLLGVRFAKYWKSSRAWLNERSKSRRVYEWLSNSTRRWDEWRAKSFLRANERAYLYLGTRLDIASEWEKEHRDEINQLERSFLDRSREEQQDQLQEAQRRVRVFGALGIAALVAAGLATVFFLRAREQRGVAETERDRAEKAQTLAEKERDRARVARDKSKTDFKAATSRQLAAQAIRHIDDEYEFAQLLALKAREADDTFEARSAVVEVVYAKPRIERYFDSHTKPVHAVAMASNGLFAVSGDNGGQIKRWDLATGKQLSNELAGLDESIWSLAVSPDNRWLAVGSGDQFGLAKCSVTLWDLSITPPQSRPLECSRLAPEEPHPYAAPTATAVTFMPHGEVLVSSHMHFLDGGLLAWDVLQQREMWRVPSEKAFPRIPCRSSSPKDTKCYDHIVSVAFGTKLDSFVTGYNEGRLACWQFNDGVDKEPARIQLVAGEHEGPVHVSFSPTGNTFATGAENGAIRIWDAKSCKPISKPMMIDLPVTSLSFESTGKTLVVAGAGKHGRRKGHVSIWNVEHRQQIGEPIQVHADGVYDLAVSSDGRRAITGSRDGTVAVVNVRARSVLGVARELRVDQEDPHKNPSMGKVVLSPDGKWLASGAGGELLYGTEWITIWDAQSETPLQRLSIGDKSITDMAFNSPGDRLAAAGTEGSLVEWEIDPKSGHATELRRFANRSSRVDAIAYNSAGDLLLSASDGELLIWNLKTPNPEPRVHELPININSAAVSPDGNTVAIAGHVKAGRGATTILWGIRDGSILHELTPAHDKGARGPSFSPDGRLLAIGAQGLLAIFNDQRSTGELWDVGTRTHVWTVQHDDSAGINSTAFNPDGSLLLTASGCECVDKQGEIRLWDVAGRRRFGGPIRVHPGGVYSGTFAADGKSIFAGGEHGLIARIPIDPDELEARACAVANMNIAPSKLIALVGAWVGAPTVCPGATLPIIEMQTSPLAQLRASYVRGFSSSFPRGSLAEVRGPEATAAIVTIPGGPSHCDEDGGLAKDIRLLEFESFVVHGPEQSLICDQHDCHCQATNGQTTRDRICGMEQQHDEMGPWLNALIPARAAAGTMRIVVEGPTFGQAFEVTVEHDDDEKSGSIDGSWTVHFGEFAHIERLPEGALFAPWQHMSGQHVTFDAVGDVLRVENDGQSDVIVQTGIGAVWFVRQLAGIANITTLPNESINPNEASVVIQKALSLMARQVGVVLSQAALSTQIVNDETPPEIQRTTISFTGKSNWKSIASDEALLIEGEVDVRPVDRNIHRATITARSEQKGGPPVFRLRLVRLDQE